MGRVRREQSGQLFSPGDVARLLGFSLSSVIRWCEAKAVQSWRVPGSRHRRIERAEVVRLIVAHGLPVPAGWEGEVKTHTEGANATGGDGERGQAGGAAAVGRLAAGDGGVPVVPEAAGGGGEHPADVGQARVDTAV